MCVCVCVLGGGVSVLRDEALSKYSVSELSQLVSENCCGKKPLHICCPEVKCFIQIVKETHKEKRHDRKELGFSLHGMEKSCFSLTISLDRFMELP